MWNETINYIELIEAGIGFTIQDEDTPLERFQVRIREDYEMGNGPGIDTPYWTTSGDNPITQDEAWKVDESRSAGGWNQVSPENDEDYQLRIEAEPILDLGPSTSWGEYLGYLGSQKNLRNERFLAIFDWLRSQKNSDSMKKAWKKFRTKVIESNKKCYKTHDWSNLFLTKAQVELLEKYFLIRLRCLH